jgi:hypothetical protein
MEKMMPAAGNPALDDLVFDLVQKSSALASQLHPVVQRSVGDFVRSMNCYYSNLIEGHDTHPWDIARALAKDYASKPEKRHLQLEAVAHIEVQQMIDAGSAPEAYPATVEYVVWLHKEFCERLPEAMRWVEEPETGERVQVVPGKLRDRPVRVGRLSHPYRKICPALCSALKKPMRRENTRNPDGSSQRQPHITACYGYTRSLTGTGG